MNYDLDHDLELTLRGRASLGRSLTVFGVDSRTVVFYAQHRQQPIKTEHAITRRSLKVIRRSLTVFSVDSRKVVF